VKTWRTCGPSRRHGRQRSLLPASSSNRAVRRSRRRRD
jgi:hypothetical protein